MASVNSILSYVPLTESVQVIADGLPRVLPDYFWSLTEDVPGTKARLIESVGQRQTARVSPANSPPRPRGKLTLDDKAIVLLSSTEELEFDEELCNILQNWEAYTPQQDWAMRNVAYQGEGFRRLFENLEIASVLLNVATGVNYFDADGNLLPTSSGATLTVDQGIPANNKGQLNGLLTGSFADPAFDIPGFLTQKFRPRAIGDTGYPSRVAVYGGNIPGYMRSNNFVKGIWDFQSEYANFYASTGQIKSGFLGFDWVPASEAYFQDQNGTNQFVFPADQITFMPEVTKATYTFYRGSKKVPTQFGPLPDGPAALKAFSEVFGRGRYAYIPMGGTFRIIDVAFTTFLSRFKVPGSVYLLDTTP
ncbi:unnamed protein product [Gemmataceae bacterium]|nr:unnamed protein product [Gemmataceae bacterium]VTT98933.1 unnamed protein product [Gemmataceae bacterium]